MSKFYGETAAVRSLNFKAKSGEVVGLLGENGAGKTTTLRMLAGLLTPSTGQIRVGGFDLNEDAQAARAQLGFLPEVPPLYPEMQVSRYLEFVGAINGLWGQGLKSAVEKAIETCALGDYQYARIDTLSFGYRRRVGLAHVIVHRPPLILLDEPTSGLDPKQVQHMRGLIKKLRQKHTIIVSSHILTEIQALCDRLLVLKDGQLIAEGTEQNIASSLQTQASIYITVKGDKEQILELLNNDIRVTSIGKHNIQTAADEHALMIQSPKLKPQDIAKIVVNAGFDLCSLSAESRNLENLFLKLTDEHQATDASSTPLSH